MSQPTWTDRREALDPEAADTGAPGAPQSGGFQVRLDNFEGPFDLLLSLIAKHKLDVTEVALGVVTDEFIAYIKAAGEECDLEQTTHFLVVAATLLDLKTARLLPSADVEDEEDLALLEARDLLFARLLLQDAGIILLEVLEGAVVLQGDEVVALAGVDEDAVDVVAVGDRVGLLELAR